MMIYADRVKPEIGRVTKVILLTLFLLLTYTNLNLQAHTQEVDLAERQNVEFRVPPKSAIEKYGKESRFQYIEEVEEISESKSSEPGAFVKFIGRLIAGLASLFASPIFVWLVISSVVVLGVYLIAKYARIDLRAILRGKAKKISNADMVIAADDVEETEYSGLIRDAIANKEYRLAIRYLYLQNLKLLAEKNIIKWRTNKTNHSYIHEISDAGLKGDFRDSTLIFDYVWYGEIEVDETNFGALRGRLDDIYKLVKSHA